MLKQIFWASILLLIVMLHAPSSLAVSVDAVPNPQQVKGGWVMDLADLLSEATEATLNQSISDLNAKNGAEVMVVTVPDTLPSKTPQQFATDLFDRWHLAQSDEKLGALFLISKDEHRVEIKTGLRTILLLSNNQVSGIINSLIIPQFKQDKFDQGTLVGTHAILSALQTAPSFSHPSLKRLPLWLRGLLLIAVFVGVPIFAWGLDRRLRPKLGNMSYKDYCDRYRNDYNAYGGDSAYTTYDGDGGSCGGGGGSDGGGAGGSW